jgi:hypothetical protein
VQASVVAEQFLCHYYLPRGPDVNPGALVLWQIVVSSVGNPLLEFLVVYGDAVDSV